MRRRTADDWINESSFHIGRQDYAEARENVEHALALEPHNAVALYSRCLMSFYLRDYDRAFTEADEACKHIDTSMPSSPAGDSPSVMLARSERVRINSCIALQQNYSDALTHIDWMLARGKPEIWLFVDRAVVNIGLGKYREALEDLRKVDSLYDDKTSHYQKMQGGGSVLESLRSEMAAYRPAIDRVQAEAYFHLGRFSEALACYERIQPAQGNLNTAYLYANDDWNDIQEKHEAARLQAGTTSDVGTAERKRWWQRH